MFKRNFMFSLAIITILFIIGLTEVPAQEAKPGDIIDSSNIEQYKEYFPPFMQRYIKDGWGIEKPVFIKVKKTEPAGQTKAFLDASKRNKEKVKLDENGLPINFEGTGFPFPDPEEPNMATKIMWNQFYKDQPDDLSAPGYMSVRKRKGGKITIQTNWIHHLKFSGRTQLPPLPEIDNPKELMISRLLDSRTPPYKGMTTLTWQYKDPQKNDDMWTYVPTLRRTVRMVSSERANPIRGTTLTWDDIHGFDGKIPQFNFKLLRDQSVLSLIHQKTILEELKDAKNYPFHPVLHHDEEFEVTDCYVIEITPKNPRYPSARKIVWIAKSNFLIHYAEVFDKKNEFWKGFNQGYKDYPVKTTNGEESVSFPANEFATDFKTFYWSGIIVAGSETTNNGLDPALFAPGTLGNL